MSDEGIPKSEFAALARVSAARVSQWVGEGKIHGEALDGSGRHAKIRPAIAFEQLRSGLDVVHRARSTARATLEFPVGAAGPEGAPSAPRFVNEVEQQIQAERLEGLRRDNRRKAEEEAARSGRYVLADDASRTMGRIAAMLFGSFESWLGELASKLAAAFGLTQRDVLYVLRREFRVFRASTASALRREAIELPEFVEDDTGDVPAPVDQAAADERRVER